ncbi:uncharacterized protein Rsod [Planococcus citri]|uniref:uncharacterized protein Rsod n=1 Tax=Planococcus citri TaxID=170843 RepID=UPI0031F7CEAD
MESTSWRLPCIFALALLYFVPFTSAVENIILAHIDENDLRGIIQFKKSPSEDIVTVTGFIKSLSNGTSENVSWNIRQLPVDYTIFDDRCSNQNLGPIRQNLDSMFGRLGINRDVEFSVSTNILVLTGSQGIWQSSLVLELPDGKRSCATLVVSKDTDIKVAEAKLYGPVFGTVYFFWIGITGSVTDAVIISDLYHIHKHKLVSSQHKWGIFVTDILETTHDKIRLECNTLQLPYNDLGDMSSKLGHLKTGKKTIFRDPTFAPIDLYQNDHTYYVLVYDDIHKDSFSSCASISSLPEIALKSLIDEDGFKVNVTLSQRSPFDPTFVRADFGWTNDNEIGGLRIHSLPVLRNYYEYKADGCYGIRDVFNPTNKAIGGEAPFPENRTQDMYAIGDLSGKLGYRIKSNVDSFLPLSGRFSVFHRSIVIYRNGKSGVEEPWLCGVLSPFLNENSDIKLPMVTAEVIFQYPISGKILFRQLANQEYSDTVVIVESLLYSDGSTELDTSHHNWTINEKPPGKDYYSWQNRCFSAESVFNPFKLPEGSNLGPVNAFSFAYLSSTLSTLTIVARKVRAIENSRNFFVAANLPLTGHHSIIGKSLVIYDENGPKARGNRLACSVILPVNRRKAVVRDWFGNGEYAGIMGDIEMYQMSNYDTVDIEMDVQGLQDVQEYHIHMVPIEEELQFPCENSSIYDVWNPLNISSASASYSTGLKTNDQFKMGDLSAKFGDWNDMMTVNSVHNDSNLQMFGHHSLLGRSFVVMKKQSDKRWACATIERGYSPLEARELRAIASFHHPQGFVYGYIRMTQLIHVDGSKSDTVIEVNLRHAGKQNRNVTHGHFWLVYVNPVGVDATVEAKHTRCTAAGYVWNPNFIQLAAPINDVLYYAECGPDQPYRCYAGDLSGRLGTISIGAERMVFSDCNLPLEGDISAMGKSIVILDKNQGHDKFSCANIEPDKDIIKYANIRRSPKFVLSQFLTEVREILGAPEWMLTVDNRKTKVLHNGACIQLLFHFKGPSASEIEQDFSRLMRTGKLQSPTISNPGYNLPVSRKKQLNYQNCPSRDADNKKRLSGNGAANKGSAGLVTAAILIVKGFLLLNLRWW